MQLVDFVVDLSKGDEAYVFLRKGRLFKSQ